MFFYYFGYNKLNNGEYSTMRFVCCLLLWLTFTSTVGAVATPGATEVKIDYQFAAIEHLAEQEIGKIILTQIYHELGLNIEIIFFRATAHNMKRTQDKRPVKLCEFGLTAPKTKT